MSNEVITMLNGLGRKDALTELGKDAFSVYKEIKEANIYPETESILLRFLRAKSKDTHFVVDLIKDDSLTEQEFLDRLITRKDFVEMSYIKTTMQDKLDEFLKTHSTSHHGWRDYHKTMLESDCESNIIVVGDKLFVTITAFVGWAKGYPPYDKIMARNEDFERDFLNLYVRKNIKSVIQKNEYVTNDRRIHVGNAEVKDENRSDMAYIPVTWRIPLEDFNSNVSLQVMNEIYGMFNTERLY